MMARAAGLKNTAILNTDIDELVVGEDSGENIFSFIRNNSLSFSLIESCNVVPGPEVELGRASQDRHSYFWTGGIHDIKYIFNASLLPIQAHMGIHRIYNAGPSVVAEGFLYLHHLACMKDWYGQGWRTSLRASPGSDDFRRFNRATAMRDFWSWNLERRFPFLRALLINYFIKIVIIGVWRFKNRQRINRALSHTNFRK
jgi:hypothetical protein